MKKNENEGCKCVMAGGYISGWGEIMLNKPQASAEILCRARGDEKCIFIRSAPHKLYHHVQKYCEDHKIINHQGLPNFLRNRKKTIKNFKTEEVEDETWFNTNYKKIYRDSKKKRLKTGFNYKAFNNQKHSIKNDVIEKATEQLDKFIIDPRSGIVELAGDKCILIRGEAISRGFYSLVKELFITQGKSTNGYETFASIFLFDLGKSIGKSNHNWFTGRIKLKNVIQKAKSICIVMKYFGWSNITITEGLSVKEIMKKKRKFCNNLRIYN